jgi:hypothetical protein
MSARLSETELKAACNSFISVSRTDHSVEITLPVIYPGGKAVSVVVEEGDDGQYVVHDASQGEMQLTLSGIEVNKKLRHRLELLAKQFGCSYNSGRVLTKCTADQIPVAIVLVSNASKSVGDHAMRLSAEQADAFRHAVSDRLRSIVGKRLREREPIAGDSGQEYRVGHIILDQNEKAPIAFVEAVPNSEAVPRKVSEFLDLSDQYPDVKREAIYDDKVNWENHSLLRLKRVSNPVAFTISDSRIRAIAEPVIFV